MSRDTVMDAVKELVNAGYVVADGTGGGSRRNTNQFEFRLPTGGNPTSSGARATGGTDPDTSGGEDTAEVEQAPHELSTELSRTTAKKLVEADGPQGDELCRYWRANGVMEPFRVHRGLYYEPLASDPALVHLEEKGFPMEET